MTIQDLYSSVAQLGFETSLESNDRFFYAVNRAILQVNRVKPATATYKLYHLPIKNLLGENTFEPIKKEDEEALTFVAENAKSYYFECSGNGTAYIEKLTDGNEWSQIDIVELTSAYSRFEGYKGFILDGGKPVKGTVRIRFLGEYSYYVQNVALYGSLLSGNKEDIPVYGKYVEYDFAHLTDDFMSFVCPPIVDAQRGKAFTMNQDYFVEGSSKLLIPASASGAFDVCYNRRPKEVTATDMENGLDIDLDEELCAILPNLVASYIWVDDEPDKAQYYLSLYREQVAEIVAKERNMRPIVYRNKTGW
jgi:hypothetical protein